MVSPNGKSELRDPSGLFWPHAQARGIQKEDTKTHRTFWNLCVCRVQTFLSLPL